MNALLATMHPDELRQIMSDLGCKTQQQLATKIGVSRPSVNKWLLGAGIPRNVAMLLRILVKQEEAA